MKATQGTTPNGGGASSAVVPRPRKSPPLMKQPATLMEAIIAAASDPSLDISRCEQLIKLHGALEAAAAERAFNDALAIVQAAMTPVSKDAANPQTSSRYASLAQLDRALRPIYSAHGFSVTFDTGQSSEAAIEVIAYLAGHGHQRRYSLPMPCDGKGPKGGDVMSKTHAVASAVTYGRRYLLCMAFNISTEDDDGNGAGAKPKSAYQARRENDYPRIEKRLRGAKSEEDLHRVWQEEKRTIYAFPTKWRDHIVEVKDLQRRALNPMEALEASLQYLENGDA